MHAVADGDRGVVQKAWEGGREGGEEEEEGG